MFWLSDNFQQVGQQLSKVTESLDPTFTWHEASVSCESATGRLDRRSRLPWGGKQLMLSKERAKQGIGGKQDRLLFSLDGLLKQEDK